MTITPQRSASVTVGTSEHSFSTTITVPSDADFGSFSIAVTCDRWDQLTRTVTIRIARPPTVATTTTTSRTGVPVSEVEAQPSASQIAIPAPAPPSGSDPTRLVQDALALVGLLLAIAVATLVLHRRGRHLRRPAEPRLRVRVVEGAAPMIHVHRSGAMPALRVRLFGADPLLQIREIPR
ncbi:hypothetical protein [Nocardia higoensis]|uniref:hypothetical protein n=1 Tax=Nocardia higoensis TaxID=228599 RepID=UPI0012F6ADBE|nr:hypothetical protein [Nocardia higoensis]